MAVRLAVWPAAAVVVVVVVVVQVMIIEAIVKSIITLNIGV